MINQGGCEIKNQKGKERRQRGEMMQFKKLTEYPSSECCVWIFHRKPIKRPHFLHGLIKHKKRKLLVQSQELKAESHEDVSLQGLPKSWRVY